jgi:SAM-dependent methyltransferase
MELARRVLGGLGPGIEIGAAAFNAFPGVRAFNFDFPGAEVYRRAQIALAGSLHPVAAWAAAERLPVATGALAFVLNSHVIEHMPDTIAALLEWDRVLRIGGVAFFIVPHKERTFDAPRPRTELEHHLADFALGMSATTDSMAPTSHYHAWVLEDFLALLAYLNEQGALAWDVEAVEEVDSKVGNGFTVVARKRAFARPRASAPGPVAFHFARFALPFQTPLVTLDRVLRGARLADPAPLERGTWRVTPIRTGFPPTAGATFELAVGPPVAPPRIDSVRMRESALWLSGAHFYPTTWLEARFVDGSRHPGLARFEAGDLVLELAGLLAPPTFELTAINPPPGGGRSAPFPWRMPS